MSPNEIVNRDTYIAEIPNYVSNPDVAFTRGLELIYFTLLIITLIFIIIEVLKSKNKKETLKSIIVKQGIIMTISLLLIVFRNSELFSDLSLEGFLYFLPSIIAVIISIKMLMIEIKKIKAK